MRQTNAAINPGAKTLLGITGERKNKPFSAMKRKILKKINRYLENISPIAYTYFAYWK